MRVRYSFSSRKTGNLKNIKRQRKKFPDVVRKLIFESDIILEVLDARFIHETRNFEIENEIKKQKKRIIYILNKADLINFRFNPKESKGIAPYVMVSCKERIGGKELRNKIKIISKDIHKEKVSVGVIGYPNTGKSSLINLLIGKSSAKTGAEAGFTKGVQKLKLSEAIVLIDSPGVIPQEEYTTDQTEKISKHVKIGIKNYGKVKDSEIAVTELMRDYPNRLERFYKINCKGNSEVLLEELGKRKNTYKKGGEVDMAKVAMLVLKDWQEGKIK